MMLMHFPGFTLEYLRVNQAQLCDGSSLSPEHPPRRDWCSFPKAEHILVSSAHSVGVTSLVASR
jgi:hypothetical protein